MYQDEPEGCSQDKLQLCHSASVVLKMTHSRTVVHSTLRCRHPDQFINYQLIYSPMRATTLRGGHPALSIIGPITCLLTVASE
jgi:hypothetical protein